jgi:hypothetical protein
LQIFDHASIKPLLAALDMFVTSCNARQFDGTIFFQDAGFKIEYMLPGRRILQHYVRTTRLEESTNVPEAIPMASALVPMAPMVSASAPAPVATATRPKII